MIKKNDIIPLKIENCTIDGSGIGRYEGMAIFVPASATGDEIDAHILKVKSSYAFGKVEHINKPSNSRIKPECPVFLKCGGCAFGHISYDSETKIKADYVADCLHRIGGLSPEIEPIIPCEKPERYRNKAQYPIEKNEDEIKIGFYGPRSHRVIHCPDCLLQPNEFENILSGVCEYVKKYNISTYNEEEHKGLLRHIYIRKGTKSGEIMVCPVINGNSLPDENEFVNMILSSCSGIKSIVLNSNKEKTNVILGRECRTLWGKDYITDTLCNLKFKISPLSFYQVNRDQAEKLYNKAAEYAELKGNELLLDLYCGTGTIGLSMAHKVKKLIGVEIVPEAIEDAKINAKENGIDNAEFYCSDAAKMAEKFRNDGVKPNVVILDPPRKGCAKEVLECVADMNPDRIVYISCDPATLARDLKIFASLDYETIKATPVDLFARTGHCETVALMSRKIRFGE